MGQKLIVQRSAAITSRAAYIPGNNPQTRRDCASSIGNCAAPIDEVHSRPLRRKS